MILFRKLLNNQILMFSFKLNLIKYVFIINYVFNYYDYRLLKPNIFQKTVTTRCIFSNAYLLMLSFERHSPHSSIIRHILVKI